MRAGSLIALSLALGSLLACEQILSIEDATEIQDGSPGVGGSGGSGGSGGTAGAAAGGSAGTGGSGGVSGSSTGGSAGVAGSAGAVDGGDDGDSGLPPTLCETYCNTVMANCKNNLAVYAEMNVCLAACAALPAGKPGDKNINSVECRLNAANNAKVEPLFYCPGAGPGGQGICGTNCEGYCSLMEGICTGPYQKFANNTECMNACSPLADKLSFNIADPAMYTGNHVQCRLFHVCAATVDDPELHCGHAAGAPPCS